MRTGIFLARRQNASSVQRASVGFVSHGLAGLSSHPMFRRLDEAFAANQGNAQ